MIRRILGIILIVLAVGALARTVLSGGLASMDVVTMAGYLVGLALCLFFGTKLVK